ncbi:MAG: hypothetical protein GX165_06070 [Firmicutes bacterium]|jgi:hypothetical protein|nr:hypothetical protein [Bacillota bacterium]
MEVVRAMVPKPVFITPHAVKQFQRRVAHWPAGAVIDFLLSRLQRLPDEVDVSMGTLLYRVPFVDKHITVVVGRGEGAWPAVITVIGDTQRLDRLLSWRGRRWGSRDAGRLRILRRWGFTPQQCAEVMGKPLGDISKRWRE